jgi:hypothetical protein
VPARIFMQAIPAFGAGVHEGKPTIDAKRHKDVRPSRFHHPVHQFLPTTQLRGRRPK